MPKSLVDRLSKAWNALIEDEVPSPVSSTNKLEEENAYTPTDPDDLSLGMFAIDKLTGVIGYLCCRRETITGMVQYAIQRAAVKGFQPPLPEFTDWNNLEVFPDEERLVVVDAKNVDYAKFGEHVKETVSGQEGIVVEKMIHLNGCVTVQCEYVASDGERRAFTVHNTRLEIVEGKDLVTLPVLPEETPKGTGGFGCQMQRL